MGASFDLIVIGGGPAGYVAAIRAAQLGLQVACVEAEPLLGGTCLRVGCIPSKALLESSERFAEARVTLAAHGVRVGTVELDLGAMMQRKTDIVQTLAKGLDGLFRKHRITRVVGRGRLAGAGQVVVGDQRLTARQIILATGSRPADLPGVPVDGERIGTSTEALSYREVPRHLIVIGAGYIGLELGSVWRRLGAEVTVLEFLPRILPGMDSELAAEAQKIFSRQGLRFQLNCRVRSAHVEGNECVVEVEGGEPVRGDRVLVAVGRRANTAGLGLDTVGITPDGRGFIPVNENFQTSVPGIYAIGDVIGGPMLAHKAEEEAVACVERIVTGVGHVDYNTIPSVCYTEPEIAAVGRTEDQLKEQGVAYRKGVFPFLANGRARTLGQTEGRVKILADARTDRVLGVHIIGPRAGELIAEAATAMAFGASSEDLARCCHAHPTLAEAIKEAALAVDGRMIHA
ncbi:MAG: dihydrolipoyl dehydrogenase [Verrucomicrobiae bacterium]|nr:dihydrolipoyl dehydrogenase [Verrucomicrobiae bacterium]